MAYDDLEPADVARRLAEGSIVLIDVREAHEFEAARIAGAVLYPLSRFDPNALPVTDGRAVVLHCAAGMRSAKAMAACEEAGVAIEGHMSGGLHAWINAGLPVIP